MKRSEKDPFALLALDDLADQEWFDAIDAALRCFDPENPAPLITLLESEGEHARRNGLHVFGYVREPLVALDAALASRGDSSVYARSSLMDGVLGCSQDLRPDQASRVMQLVADKEEIIRDKAITYLACAPLETLESAIELLDEPHRRDHADGFQHLLRQPENVQALFDSAIVNVDVQSSYALASIKRLARQGVVTSPPAYEGDSYVPSGVIQFVNMWIARWTRRRVKSEE